jgi:threonine synthase
MNFVSTRGSAPAVPFRTALFEGLAPDGGLYVPATIPTVAFDDLRDASRADVATTILAAMLGGEIPAPALDRLLRAALDFPIPTTSLADGVSVLELFHGPTFAFKDVGARSMARLMAHFNDGETSLTVLVATSGDTGSAVAQAFFGVSGTRVVVLFPEGGVTPVQEAQFATLGGNVTAAAVAGTFDDCQRIVKEAFADRGLRTRHRLTSANSINIGRLLPQMIYYAHAALQQERPCVFSVPSGNVGNLTAGVLAWRMGAPIAGFVAATTINDTFPRYLQTGHYQPRASVKTLANAMDVGDPSNVERLRWLFADNVASMKHVVAASIHTDAEVLRGIRELRDRWGYVCDPHSAIAYRGLVGANLPPDRPGVFLATAHPAKFREAVEPAIGESIPLPAALAEAMRRPRHVERLRPELAALRDLLG